MKNLFVLLLLIFAMNGNAQAVSGSPDAPQLFSNATYWMLSIAGCSAFVWLIVRYLYDRQRS